MWPGAPERPKGKGGRHNEKGTLPEPKILKIIGFWKLIRFVKQFISEFRILTKKEKKKKRKRKKSKYKRTNINLYFSYNTTRAVRILIQVIWRTTVSVGPRQIPDSAPDIPDICSRKISLIFYIIIVNYRKIEKKNYYARSATEKLQESYMRQVHSKIHL